MSWLKTENQYHWLCQTTTHHTTLFTRGNISPTSQWNAYPLLTRNLGIIKVFSRRFSNPPSSNSQAVSSPVSIAILQEAINFAREQGAKQLITTSPLGVERLLRAAGFVPIVQVHQ